MKLKVFGSCAILLIAAMVAVSQQPPARPSAAPHPGAAPAAAEYPPAAPEPAQQPQPAQAPHPPPPPPDPVGQNLFPPELVMQHRQAIGLTDDQRNAIKQELMRASTRFNE